MPPISVLVAETSPDIQAEGIAAGIEASDDMVLAQGRVVSVLELERLLDAWPPEGPHALVLVGPPDQTQAFAEYWLALRGDLVVVRVDAPLGNRLHVSAHGIGLAQLISVLRNLVEHEAAPSQRRVVHLQLHAVVADPAQDAPPPRGLWDSATEWVHAVLRHAVARLGEGQGDLPGLTLSATTMAELLDARRPVVSDDLAAAEATAHAALMQALADSARAEPLRRAVEVFALTPLELQLFLLALAPELDLRYQRCIGLLLDDLGRRCGTLGLYAALLGDPLPVRQSLAHSGNLVRWRVFDAPMGELPPANEPLRLDPALVGWLLGGDGSLRQDRLVRALLRVLPWPGASLLEAREGQSRAAALVARLCSLPDGQWLVLAGNGAAEWRALLEAGARRRQMPVVRVEAARLAGLDRGDAAEAGRRLGRLARLTGSLLAVDTGELPPAEDEALRLLLSALWRTGLRGALVVREEARAAGLLGTMPYRVERIALDGAARVAVLRHAADGARTPLGEDGAAALQRRLGLPIDGLERAMRVAGAQAAAQDGADAPAERFVSACEEVAAEGLSGLAQRIEPVFGIDDVVLPPDRKEQLVEIVNNVRLADKVLDEWQFGTRLPYGRGVTALFHGPSGTGKTMAGMGIARALGVPLLRLDLSHVVSKYIGETEKNIDLVFHDAERSGAAILIDEADALFGKRSEVKDAHDRYANIEVAFLLQRMEAYAGLAILTTNLRQNLDTAFLRRLRFIVDFPRPDVDAREEIWRRCLPAGSHEIEAAAFRHLARRVDLTGGHIRQVTLRAAFLAAADDSPIRLAHVVRACRAECAKLGLPPIDLEPPAPRRAA